MLRRLSITVVVAAIGAAIEVVLGHVFVLDGCGGVARRCQSLDLGTIGLGARRK